MRRAFILSLVALLILSVTPLTFAQDAGEEVVVDEITAEDLGISNPGILPTNPFYFFKEFARGFRGFFIFDPVKRAENELKIINEKAAEIDAVDEVAPDDSDALRRAIDNYDENVDRLRARLEELANSSDNPDIDELLNQLADRAVKHQQLFDELSEKHEEIRDRIGDTQDGLDNVVRPMFDRLGTCEELKGRLEGLLSDGENSPREILNILRFIDRMEGRDDSDEIFECLDDIRARLIELLEGSLDGADIDIEDILEGLPWGEDVRLRIVNDARGEASDSFRDRLDDIRAEILDRIDENDIDREDAEEAIHDAEELVNKLREKIDSGEYEVIESVRGLLGEAEILLANARRLFEDENYGAAFGEATASRVAARSGLVILERLHDELDDKDEDLDDDEENRNHRDEDKDEDEIDDEMDSRESIRPLPFPINLNRIFPGASDAVSCIQVYEPVCGSDGETYSNECLAKASGVDVIEEGPCGNPSDIDESDSPDSNR